MSGAKHFCIVDDIEKLKPLVGRHMKHMHYLRLPDGHYLVVWQPHGHGSHKRLTEAGANHLPSVHSRAPIGKHATKFPKGSKILAEHTTYEAMKLAAEHFGWLAADPDEP